MKLNMRIRDIRATTVTVPLEAPLAPRQWLPLGPLRAHHRRSRDRQRPDRPGRNGRRRRIGRSRVPRHESRTWWATIRRAWRKCASSSPTPPPRSTTIARRCWRRSNSPASISSAKPGACRSATFWAAGCATAFPSPPTASSAIPIRAPARAKSAPSTNWSSSRRALKQRFGFTTHKLKAGVFPPDYELEAYRALAAAFPDDSLALRPQRRLVHRAGHPLRPGHRSVCATIIWKTPSSA